MKPSLEITTSHPHFYLKKQSSILFCINVWERLPCSKTFASLLANFENHHEKQEVLDKNAYKEEVKAYAGLINNTLS